MVQRETGVIQEERGMLVSEGFLGLQGPEAWLGKEVRGD